MNNFERVTEPTESTKPPVNVEFNPSDFSTLKQMQPKSDLDISSKIGQQAHTANYIELTDPFQKGVISSGVMTRENGKWEGIPGAVLNKSEEAALKILGKESFGEEKQEHRLQKEDKMLHRELRTELKEERTLKQEQRLLEKELGFENKDEQKQTLKKEEGVLDKEFRVESKEEHNLKMDEKVQEREFRLAKDQARIVEQEKRILEQEMKHFPEHVVLKSPAQAPTKSSW